MKDVRFQLANGESVVYPNILTQTIEIDEARVLASASNDLSLMCELEGRDNLFTTTDGRMYYELLLNMYQNNVDNFDAGSVQLALNRLGDSFKARFLSVNGTGYLNALRRDFSSKNFNAHLEELVKTNSKTMLYKYLYQNIYDIATANNVSIDSMIQKTEVSLDEVKEIREISTTKPITLRVDDEYIQGKTTGAKKGLSYGLRSLSRATRGVHTGNMSMLAMFSNAGKSAPFVSLLYTPNGYIRMGDVKIGDTLFDMNGKRTKVTGIFPQGVKDNYKLTFKDGTTAECGLEHLWTVYTKSMIKTKAKEPKVMTLGEIMDYGLLDTAGAYKVLTPVNKALEYDKKEFLIDPYLLGALLGDGGIKRSITFSTSELEMVENVRNRLPKGFTIEKVKGDNYYYSISDHSGKNSITDNLRKLKLFGLGSHEKFIPKDYFYGSKEQRLDLLKGLFDTDGSVNKTGGNKSISTTSIRLRDDIIHLCHTLGYRASYITDNRDYKFGKCYQINIWTYDEIFTTSKHKNRVPKNRKVRKRVDLLAITKIEKLEPTEMQCIMVDSPTHTYLTDNMIVTHNTTINYNEFMMDFLEAGEKVFIYSNESSIEDFKDMLLIRTLTRKLKYFKLTRTKINELDIIKAKNPSAFQEYLYKIKEAQAYIDTHYGDKLVLFSVSRYSIAEFNMLHRRYAYRGFKYFLIDTMKSEDAGDKMAIGRLVQQSRNIYELARKLDTHVMVSYQVASYLKQSLKRIIDESCLSGSKQIIEILDILITGRELYQDEYPNQKREIKVYTIKKENGEFKRDYKTLESDKKYIILFLPKNRYGEKILPTLHEFQGAFGITKEIGLCENVMDR